MPRLATIVALLFLGSACGGAPADAEDEAALSVVASIGPQSLTQGALGGSRRQLGYAFSGKAGEVIAPDVWPTAGGGFTPTLTLLGPRNAGGHRTVVAVGTPRGTDPRHLAIDGFRLPRSGSYLVLVGLSRRDKAGRFSLRLWMQSSHLPRQEASQVDLSPAPSDALAAALDAHGQSPHAWTDPEVDGIVADMLQQKDPKVALSTAQGLLAALASPDATSAQRGRASLAAARMVGTQQRFRSLQPHLQAFALWWLGTGDAPLFETQRRTPPENVGDTIAQLVAAWPRAHEDAGERQVQALVLGGAVYGWQVDWRAAVTDSGGAQAWVDFAREWFDSAGNWLGEQSAGAGEPDDD